MKTLANKLLAYIAEVIFLTVILLGLSASVSARDWDEVNQERNFDAYRWEEQQRFEYEQDREDRNEYRQRSLEANPGFEMEYPSRGYRDDY